MKRRSLGRLVLAALPGAASAKETARMDALAEDFIEQLWQIDTEAASLSAALTSPPA